MNERKISSIILVAGWRRRRPPDSAGPGHVSRRGDAAPRDWTRDLCHVCRGQAGARADVRGRGQDTGVSETVSTADLNHQVNQERLSFIHSQV